MNLRRLWMTSLFICVLLVISPCGKKGPPHVKKKGFPGKVVDLKGVYEEGYIFLTGRIADVEGAKNIEKLVKGSRIYYAQYPLENPPCPECPVNYLDYQESGSEVIEEKGFSGKLGVKKRGHIYFLKVHLLGSDGTIGPPSRRVEVVVE